MIKNKFPKKKYLNSTEYFNDYINLKHNLLRQIDKKKLNEIIKIILKAIKMNKKIFSCGNGGSATTAEHLTCDFSKGSCTNTKLNIKSISLNSNTALITAIANDISYDKVFSYQLERYANTNDILLLFSVSGSSKNILECAHKAKVKKIKTISFTGFNGGKIKKLSNYNINFPTNNFGIVEDCHLTVMHYISQYIRMLNIKSIKNINF